MSELNHTVEGARADCDLFVAIGTSATVHPAAPFVGIAERGRRAPGSAP